MSLFSKILDSFFNFFTGEDYDFDRPATLMVIDLDKTTKKLQIETPSGHDHDPVDIVINGELVYAPEFQEAINKPAVSADPIADVLDEAMEESGFHTNLPNPGDPTPLQVGDFKYMLIEMDDEQAEHCISRLMDAVELSMRRKIYSPDRSEIIETLVPLIKVEFSMLQQNAAVRFGLTKAVLENQPTIQYGTEGIGKTNFAVELPPETLTVPMLANEADYESLERKILNSMMVPQEVVDKDDAPPSERKSKFVLELESLINSNSVENGSNTPDFILASYLAASLRAGEDLINHREAWYGRKKEVGTSPISDIGAQTYKNALDAEGFFLGPQDRIEPGDQYEHRDLNGTIHWVEFERTSSIMGKTLDEYHRLFKGTDYAYLPRICRPSGVNPHGLKLHTENNS